MQPQSSQESSERSVLEALEDRRCRRILHELYREPATAREISRACDIPLSTTYRKLKLLQETSLVETATRIREDGSHAREYSVTFDRVVVDLEGERGFTTRLATGDDCA